MFEGKQLAHFDGNCKYALFWGNGEKQSFQEFPVTCVKVRTVDDCCFKQSA